VSHEPQWEGMTFSSSAPLVSLPEGVPTPAPSFTHIIHPVCVDTHGPGPQTLLLQSRAGDMVDTMRAAVLRTTTFWALDDIFFGSHTWLIPHPGPLRFL
jgi:hypothetical protein